MPMQDQGFGSQMGPPADPPADQMAFQYAMRQRAMEDAQRNAISLQLSNQRQQLAGRVVGTTISRVAAPALTSGVSQGSGALGLAGTAFSAYQGAQDAGASIHAFNQAMASGALSKQEEEAARQHLFNAAMVNTGVGAGLGAIGGVALGPVGIAAGAALGGYGGLKQAYGAYDSPVDAAKAFATFQRNPFKR